MNEKSEPEVDTGSLFLVLHCWRRLINKEGQHKNNQAAWRSVLLETSSKLSPSIAIRRGL